MRMFVVAERHSNIIRFTAFSVKESSRISLLLIFQHAGVGKASTVVGVQYFEDISDALEFDPLGGPSMSNLQLEL